MILRSDGTKEMLSSSDDYSRKEGALKATLMTINLYYDGKQHTAGDACVAGRTTIEDPKDRASTSHTHKLQKNPAQRAPHHPLTWVQSIPRATHVQLRVGRY